MGAPGTGAALTVGIGLFVSKAGGRASVKLIFAKYGTAGPRNGRLRAVIPFAGEIASYADGATPTVFQRPVISTFAPASAPAKTSPTAGPSKTNRCPDDTTTRAQPFSSLASVPETVMSAPSSAYPAFFKVSFNATNDTGLSGLGVNTPRPF